MKTIIQTVALGLVILLSACQNEHKEHTKLVTFLSTTPLVKDTTITREYVCQIQSISHIELRSQERGYLQNIFVDEGQFVHKGQKLFQIMPNLYEAEMHRQTAEAKVAEIEYLNTKNLADSNIVSQNELAMTKAKYDKAKADLALAQVHLDFTLIKAPFSGYVDRFRVRLGSLLEEGELLTSLSDNSKMWVYFNVSESEYLDYKSEMNRGEILKVQLMMANNKMFDYEGKVETIEADFNNETGNIPFRATFPNPKSLLRHGETGSILVQAEYNNALLIPQKATFEILDKKYVFVIDSAETVHLREIKVEAEMQDLYIVQSGLNNSEKILLEGLRKVRDGDKIKSEFLIPEKVFSELKLYAE